MAPTRKRTGSTKRQSKRLAKKRKVLGPCPSPKEQVVPTRVSNRLNLNVFFVNSVREVSNTTTSSVSNTVRFDQHSLPQALNCAAI